jgi:hypothetical protein
MVFVRLVNATICFDVAVLYLPPTNWGRQLSRQNAGNELCEIVHNVIHSI